MTGDDFRDRYQILTRLTRGNTSTFLARAANGDRVMVHVLETPPEETRDLLARVARLTGSRDRRVREVLRHRGVDVVVTDYLDDFESLDEWLPASGPEPRSESAGEAPAREDAGEAGEFTRLFQQPPAGGEEPSSGGEEASSGEEADEGQAPEPRGPTSEPGGEPGEFTRLFELEGEGEAGIDDAPDAEPDVQSDAGREGDAARGSVPEERDEIAPREADEGSAPGEFTRMFGAASSEEEAPGGGDAAADAPDQRERRPRSRGAETPDEGERSPEPEEPGIGGRGEEGEEAGSPGPDDDGESGPGEFTRMFGSPDSPSDDRPGDRPASAGPRGGSRSRGGSDGEDDYLDRLGRGGGADVGGGAPDAGSTGPGAVGGDPGGTSSGDGGTSEGPGRYTRMMEQSSSEGGGAEAASGGSAAGGGLGLGGGGGAASPSPSGGTSGSSAQEDSDGSSRKIYIAALVGILLVAVALVVVLVVAGGGGETPEGPSPESGEGGAEQTETSALPRQDHQELELRIREVGGNVDGQIPRLADGGPVFS